ncbi:TonB-dependent receptor [Methylocella sp.]|uniref:TonB-dependent receptor n=1 Tax=Methylocella sp. TaxID=1978226 RepID=UPI00378420CD
MPPVMVDGAPGAATQTIGAVDAPSTVYEVGPTIIDLTNPGGTANPYRAVSILPSVDAPAIDAFGLANIPGSGKGFRVRGETPQHGANNLTIEGLPIAGVNPGPGLLSLLSNENVSSIRLYQGPVPSDVSSFTTNAGVLDMRLRWPEKKAGAEFSQSFGSSYFLRSFGRVDSGDLFNGTTNVFVSGSWTDADLWRGPGDGANGNVNISAGLSTRIENFEGKAFLLYNDMRQNTYRPLTYTQVQNLAAYQYYGYSNDPAALNNYYRNNRQSFATWLALAELSYAFTDNLRVVVKPFFANENGDYWDALGSGRVRDWRIDHNWYGLTAEAQGRFGASEIKGGYWLTSLGLPGPPTAWKTYAPTATGGLMSPMWAILAQETSRNRFQSVYTQLDHDFGGARLEAGARYVWNDMPGINAYSTTGVGALDYDAALAASSGVVAANSVGSKMSGAFLPYMALSYDLTPELQLRGSVGGNYGAPSYDVWPAYQQNVAAFRAAGLSADQLWRQLKLETTAAVDFGFRWTHAFDGFGDVSIEPTGYFSRSSNRNVVYDNGVGVSYGQNVGETRNAGGQLLGRWRPRDDLDFFAAVGYTSNQFVENLPVLATASAATVAAANVVGTQLPNVPQWTASFGGTWRWNGFSATPVVNFVSGRWGDTAQTQYVSGYATVDLNLAYSYAMPYGTLEASVALTNLFDARYIGFINNGYYQQSALGGAFYYPGAPRAVVGRIAVKL